MVKAEVKRLLLRLMGFRPPESFSILQLERDEWLTVHPVFVLSTGRCGTMWLTELLRHSDRLHVNHNDYPELVRQGPLAYQHYELSPEMYQEIVRACRDGYVAQAAALGQTYVETNNRITFLAAAIKAVYQNARFIHLVRHPGDFVRSGLRRKWYEGATHDEGRIRRYGEPEMWEKMNGYEKIAWLWNETNQFIEDFLALLPATEKLFIKAEEMFTDEAISRQIVGFIGVTDFPASVIRRMLSRRINVQRGGKPIEAYAEWTEQQKEQVRHYTPLATCYGYEL